MFDAVNDVLIRFWVRLANFLPNMFGGLLILIIGVVVAELLKKLLRTILTFFRLDSLLHKTGMVTQKEVRLWQEILAELVRWTVVILFLIPTLETWGLQRATGVLNQFLFYIPNVIVAVIIGFVGSVLSNLGADLVRHAVRTTGGPAAETLAAFTKSTIVFFTILVMLNQIGVAQDLIRIFFTGLVAMLAIAGGLAFGLGGQQHARELLDELRKKLAK